MAKINALQSMYGCGTPATESAVAGSQTGTYLNPKYEDQAQVSPCGT